MNSAVEPIFNESFVEKIGLWVPWTIHRTHWKSWNAIFKKNKNAYANSNKLYPNRYLMSDTIYFIGFFSKKKKKMQMQISCNPNGYLMSYTIYFIGFFKVLLKILNFSQWGVTEVTYIRGFILAYAKIMSI